MASDAFYDAILAQWPEVSRVLNPWAGRSTSNCPAVAAAVGHYLDTEEISPAPSGLGSVFEVLGSLRTATMGTIVGSLVNHGDHCVVEAQRIHAGGELFHFFNLVRIREAVYYLDAYNRPAVATTSVASYTSIYSSFAFAPSITTRRLPA